MYRGYLSWSDILQICVEGSTTLHSSSPDVWFWNRPPLGTCSLPLMPLTHGLSTSSDDCCCFFSFRSNSVYQRCAIKSMFDIINFKCQDWLMMNYIFCTVKPGPCRCRPYKLFYLLCALVNKSDQSACWLCFVQCQNLTERLKSLVNSAPVMVFMKGSPTEPRCGMFCVACWLVKCQTQTPNLHVIFILCIVFVLCGVLSITLGFHITTTEAKGKGSLICRALYYELPISKALRYGTC